MFVGRKRELAVLKRLHESEGFQFPVIYGRRRVGKTALLRKFIGDRPAIFFTAVESDRAINLRNLSRAVYAFEHPEADPMAAPQFDDFQRAFEAIFALAKANRLVFVIDEYPYLAKAESSVSSILQAVIDREKDDSNLMLVLCGSSLSFMKEQVLGEKSPLYGRRTAQIEIKPFDFFQSLPLLKGWSLEEAAQIYGMVGGIPLYLRQFHQPDSLKACVERSFFDESSILYEEPQNLLLQEVQKAGRYNAVISAIAEGRTQNNEIASTSGISSTELTYYLKELERLGLIVRELPVVRAGKRAVYHLSDNLFGFWHRFVQPYRSIIEHGRTAKAWRAVDAGLSAYMGPVFEEICRQWLWRELVDDRLSVEFDDLGRWWGTDSKEKCEAEIDIVGIESGETVLVGECKWRNEPFSLSDLRKLEHRASLVGNAMAVELYCFARSGFTDACLQHAAESPHVHLVSFGEMA